MHLSKNTILFTLTLTLGGLALWLIVVTTATAAPATPATPVTSFSRLVEQQQVMAKHPEIEAAKAQRNQAYRDARSRLGLLVPAAKKAALHKLRLSRTRWLVLLQREVRGDGDVLDTQLWLEMEQDRITQLETFYGCLD